MYVNLEFQGTMLCWLEEIDKQNITSNRFSIRHLRKSSSGCLKNHPQVFSGEERTRDDFQTSCSNDKDYKFLREH